MSDLPSGTVTFLFTDLEGSTRLWEEHPDAMQGALARHDDIVSEAIVSHDGHIVKARGDGFHAAFSTAADALSAALDAQHSLAVERWAETGPLPVRMGVHTGEVQQRDGDYFGPAVNRAARVMAVAHGGQVLCSRATVEVAGGAFPVRSLGAHRLRDLDEPLELFQLGDGVFPPLRSLDVIPTNLPTVRTELIGRSEELGSLSELARREQLVTMTGVGGVGKTRLALAVAAAIATEFADGCWLVELASQGGGDEVVIAVAAAMRAPVMDLEALAAYLSDRRALIVLDNCEHVLDAAAELVDSLLAAAPDVHVVVTSREPLGLDGEQVRRVQSLAVPAAGATTDTARSVAAVRLFAERAAAVADGFTLAADNVDAVAEICRHLDGIPLAIELAAARVGAMPPAEIARRLDERFRLLAGGSRRTQERHRTLLATVAWSHDLLSEPEKTVFRRLAVFPASFELDSVEAVAGDGQVDVVECVLHLVNRSLIDFDADAGRYRLLETLRQFGADRLTEANETETIRARHARWFLELAQRVGTGLEDAGFATARAALAVELDNLRATAEWCIEAGWWAELAAMCHALWTFFEQDAPVDGVGWLQRVADHGSELDAQVIVDVLGVLAWIQAVDLYDLTSARALGERSQALADAKGLDASAWAWNASAFVALQAGRGLDVLDAAECALTAAGARDDERAAVCALCLEASALPGLLGQLERGADVAAELLHRAERTGNAVLIAAAVVSTSASHLWARDVPDFAASLDTLTRHAVGLRSGDTNDMYLDLAWGWTLLGLDHPGVVDHVARAARTADRLNNPIALEEALQYLAIAAADAGLNGHAATLAAYAETELRPYRTVRRGEQPGRAWVQRRLDQALAGVPESPPSPSTHRRDVMALIDELEFTLAQSAQATP